MNDSTGIYLAVGETIFKLPLSEFFIISEQSGGMLTAKHKMKIFEVPFLRID